MAVGWTFVMVDDEGAREVTIRGESYESALSLASDTYPDANVVSQRRVTLPDESEGESELAD